MTNSPATIVFQAVQLHLTYECNDISEWIVYNVCIMRREHI